MSVKYIFFSAFAIVVIFFIIDVVKNVRSYNKKRKGRE